MPRLPAHPVGIVTSAKSTRTKSVLELLGDGRVRELERYHAARYGRPSFLERILTTWARK